MSGFLNTCVIYITLCTEEMNLQRVLSISKNFLKCNLHTTASMNKIQAGRYKVTRNRTKPLTYEQAFKPEEIGNKKGWNSHNTAQLDETFLQKEEIGQDLPYKMLMEDMLIRKFMQGTFPKAILSEVMIKRQHNLVRVACLISRQSIPARKIYFLLGYSEEFLSFFLKCPVKLELQSVESESDIIFKHV